MRPARAARFAAGGRRLTRWRDAEAGRRLPRFRWPRKLVASRGDAVLRHRARRRRVVFFRQRRVKLLLQYAQYALVDKVVHQARLMETHLMLGRVDVYIHLMGIDLQIQHKRRLLIGP